MFSSADIRNGAVGAGLILSSLGFSVSSVEAQERPSPAGEAGVSAPLDNLAQSLNSATRVERLSGALKDAHPPAYDGPVKWDQVAVDKERFLYPLGGSLVGALIVGGLGLKAAKDTADISGKALLVGTGLGLAGGLGLGIAAMPPAASVIEFHTTVELVESSSPAHMEKHRSGKHTVTTGPYFGEVIKIRESDMLLAVNNYQAPLVPGQKIVARFYVDSDNQIISWQAQADLR